MVLESLTQKRKNKTFPMVNIRIILSLICMGNMLVGQETVSVSGGDVQNTNGSVSYTIGQLSYTTYKSTKGSLGQGIQQALKVEMLTDPDDQAAALLIYPNPTADYVYVVLNSTEVRALNYLLFDAQGRKVSQGEVLPKETSIAMYPYATGMYILSIQQKEKELQSFKIIKK
jgi:hypothetical protein